MSLPDWTDAEYEELKENLGALGSPEQVRASVEAIANTGVRLYQARQNGGKVLPLRLVPRSTHQPATNRTLVAVRTQETRTFSCVEYAVVCVYSDKSEETVWGRTVVFDASAKRDTTRFLSASSEMAAVGMALSLEESSPSEP